MDVLKSFMRYCMHIIYMYMYIHCMLMIRILAGTISMHENPCNSPGPLSHNSIKHCRLYVHVYYTHSIYMYMYV